MQWTPVNGLDSGLMLAEALQWLITLNAGLSNVPDHQFIVIAA